MSWFNVFIFWAAILSIAALNGYVALFVWRYDYHRRTGKWPTWSEIWETCSVVVQAIIVALTFFLICVTLWKGVYGLATSALLVMMIFFSRTKRTMFGIMLVIPAVALLLTRDANFWGLVIWIFWIIGLFVLAMAFVYKPLKGWTGGHLKTILVFLAVYFIVASFIDWIKSDNEVNFILLSIPIVLTASAMKVSDDFLKRRGLSSELVVTVLISIIIPAWGVYQLSLGNVWGWILILVSAIEIFAFACMVLYEILIDRKHPTAKELVLAIFSGSVAMLTLIPMCVWIEKFRLFPLGMQLILTVLYAVAGVATLLYARKIRIVQYDTYYRENKS